MLEAAHCKVLQVMRMEEGGVDELGDSKLSGMIMAKYHSIEDAEKKLGDVGEVRRTFIDFQQHLYVKAVALRLDEFYGCSQLMFTNLNIALRGGDVLMPCQCRQHSHADTF
jgi:hypothetical protein